MNQVRISIRLLRYILFFLVLTCSAAYAIASPVVMLQSTANRMIAALHQNKARLKTSSGHVIISGIVNQILIPQVDVNRMAGMVLGRRYWNKASNRQRKIFISEFKQLVISTYASALSSFDNDKIRFYPIRGNYQNRRTMTVKSLIVRRSGQNIPISYNVFKVHSSRWKVYDFSIDNISMVENYRSQFSGILRSRGLSGLIQRLKNHNRGG